MLPVPSNTFKPGSIASLPADCSSSHQGRWLLKPPHATTLVRDLGSNGAGRQQDLPGPAWPSYLLINVNLHPF
eukprot:1264201-Rhodomonas_salina.1